jgi:type IV secretory pathway protease TraF
MTLVKRVVGLPGEKVAIDFGEVIIDGRDGVDLWGTGTTFPEGEWHLGPKEWFLLSDNRSATVDDSRGFGPVTLGGPPTMFWRMRLRGDR